MADSTLHRYDAHLHVFGGPRSLRTWVWQGFKMCRSQPRQPARKAAIIALGLSQDFWQCCPMLSLQALDVRSIAAFAIEMFNTAICSLTATGLEIRTFQFSTAFNKDAAASMQSLILGGLKWMGSMPMHDDHRQAQLEGSVCTHTCQHQCGLVQTMPICICRYLYIPITVDMWSLGPKMRAGALKDRIKELKARFPVLNYGMAMAINPCTHEYLCAGINCHNLGGSPVGAQASPFAAPCKPQ